MVTKLQRKDVIIDDIEAGKWIKDGMTLGIGGLIITSFPMPIIRQIIRNRVKDLFVVAGPSAGLNVDMLIGAGCVRTVTSAYVGAEDIIAIGPCFRRAAERGEIEVWDLDEYMFNCALYATASGLPFMPWRGGVGTDFPKFNPTIKEFNDPIKGEPLLAISAIKLDIAILYAAYADAFGCVQHEGTGFSDKILSQAADKTIVTVEKVVSNERIRTAPWKTTIHVADAIVRAPYGAHPFASPDFYVEDKEHLIEYVAAAETWRKTGDRGPYEAYLQKYIYEPASHIDYLERIGFSRILSLHEF